MALCCNFFLKQLPFTALTIKGTKKAHGIALQLFKKKIDINAEPTLCPDNIFLLHRRVWIFSGPSEQPYSPPITCIGGPNAERQAERSISPLTLTVILPPPPQLYHRSASASVFLWNGATEKERTSGDQRTVSPEISLVKGRFEQGGGG